MDCIKPISMKETAIRKMREYFVYKYDKYPEDSIEVEKAIQIFVEIEKNLLDYTEILASEVLAAQLLRMNPVVRKEGF